MTSWQAAACGEPSPQAARAAEREEAESRAEALRARRAYAKALRPRHDLDPVWAIARVLASFEEVEDVLGPPDRDVGSGIHLRAYDLAGGTAALFGEVDGRILHVRQVADAKAPLQVGRFLRTLRLAR